MKAIVFNKYGSVEELKLKDIQAPASRPGNVIVEVHSTSVNPLDFKIRRGELKFLSGFLKPKKQILGFDVAGLITNIGPGVTAFKMGDPVFAMTGLKGGAYAELVSLPENFVALKPVNMSFQEAAAVPLASLTALQALRNMGNVSSGKEVLINGASGGVGTFAVQIAKALGAEVTGVCSPDNIDLIKTLGANKVIDYTRSDFTREKGKYDIIFDSVAKRNFPECREALKPNGLYITTVPKGRDIFHLILGGKQVKFINVKANGNDLNFIKTLIEDGKVKSVIDRSFSLSQIAQAHSYAESGHSKGKNIIEVK